MEWVLRAPPGTGEPFPNMSLAVPAAQADRDYLGLDAPDSAFALGDIRAQMLLVMVFDVACHYCQKSTTHAKRIYEEIGRRNASGNVKMIAVALGNSQFEADLFRDKFQLPFPVFPDPDSTRRKLLGGRISRPSFFALDVSNAQHRIVAEQHGMFLNDRERDRFLKAAFRAAAQARTAQNTAAASQSRVCGSTELCCPKDGCPPEDMRPH